MSMEICHLEESLVLSLSKEGKLSEDAAKLWMRMEEIIVQNKVDDSKSRFYGVLWKEPGAENNRYDACIKAKEEISLEEGVKEQTLPGGKYVKINYQGPFEGALDYAEKQLSAWGGFDSKQDLKRPWVMIEYLNHEENHGNRELCGAKVYFPIK